MFNIEEIVSKTSLVSGLPVPVIWALLGAFALLIIQKLFRSIGFTSGASDIQDFTKKSRISSSPKATLITSPNVTHSISHTTLDNDSAATIKTLLEKGDKIGAIKVFRQVTNTDLATAKSAVEAIEIALKR